MKTDKHLGKVALTQNQAYFVSCWYNMVHEHSLDSYRVRAMNSRNILRELVRIYELGTVEERAAVRIEAHALLANDVLLKADPFASVSERILELLSPTGPLAGKEEGPPKALLMYFIAELKSHIEELYVRRGLDHLKQLLVVPGPNVATPAANGAANESVPAISMPAQQPFPSPAPAAAQNPTASATSATHTNPFEEIHSVTGNLLSILIDRNASLESLYALYAEILVPRYPKPGYAFARRFGLASVLLTKEASEHTITFALDNVSAPDRFPSRVGGVAFSMSPPFSVAPQDSSHSAVSAKRYLQEVPRRLFASTTLLAQDPRTAAADAADTVNHILNLVRFEYERARVTMPDTFAFVQANRTSGPRVFSLPTVVPNPTVAMDSDSMASFIASVDELVLNGRFQPEGRDRVQSAFRLYRTGLDTNVLENKLVNWWTAIEYLVRGGNSSGGIGKSVEILLSPVLCNAYIAKHLQALRAGLLDLNAKLIDPASGQPLLLRQMPLNQIYQLFKRKDIQTTMNGVLSEHVFAQQQFADFFSSLNNPKILHKKNAVHEQRLRWHLQRLWRARCDIVHSGERVVSAALLCANLEYYLKTTLMALLKALRDVPTLSGPKEFFERQAHTYLALQTDLKAGRDSALLSILAP